MSSVFNPTLATRVPVISGEEITNTSVNRQVDIPNGIEAQVALLAGSELLVTTSTTVNLVANKEVYVVMNNTSNAVVNLPSATTAKKSIIIEKGANNYTTVTVNRAGSDTLSNPFGAVAAPVGTSFILYLPGESYEFVPMGTYWRVKRINLPTNQLAFRAGLSVNTTISTTPAKLAFDTVTGTNRYNRGSFFSTVNNRFVAPFPMVATFHYSINLSALAADTAGSIRVNGTSVETLGGRHNLNTAIDMSCSTTVELATNDQVEAWINSNPARQAQSTGTFFSGIIVSRL